MKWRTVLISLLSALLLWSVFKNKQVVNDLQQSNSIIFAQKRAIKRKNELIATLEENLEKQKRANNVSTVNENDIELLAKLINAEAGSEWCSYEMKRLVGIVAINRTKNKAFPNSLIDVIYQPGQYACVIDGNIKKTPPEECYIIAKDLLKNGYDEPEDIIWQSEFKQGKHIYKKVQNMYFCS